MVDSTNLPNVDINQIATDLNNKLDRDCLNYSDTGYNFMAGAGMPSDKYIDLTLGASGSTYTAPANGYFYIHGDSYDNSNFHAITVFYNSANSWDTPVIRITQPAKLAGAADLIPVKKGQTIRIEFSDMTMRPGLFVYAVGSESEVS